MGSKILIIEDNEQNLYLMTYILKNSGYQVVQARDGQEGVLMAAKERPSLILLDIQLPVVDGYVVAKTIRADIKDKKVPIVAISSYAMPGDREKSLKYGCTDYIEKPIDPDTIMDQLKPYLPDESSGEAA